MKRCQTKSMRAKDANEKTTKIFRKDGIDCDVTLRTDMPNGRLFRANTAVLSKGSNYFQVLFGGCWRETNQDVIMLRGITDLKLEILLGT